MDPRIREQASMLVHEALELEAGADVVIKAAPAAEDLVVALHEVIGDVGANPVWLSTNRSGRSIRAYLRAHDADFETPDHERALIDAADAHVVIRGYDNVTETSDVEPEQLSAWQQAQRPILDERLTDDWVLSQFPTAAHAQLAEMSTEGYENFVWDAINKDWEAQHAFQQQMVERVNDADEVRLVSGDTTDLRMRTAGNPTINDTCTHNVPGGEVFTAPHPGSVEGEVLFDKPLYHQGREVLDAHLVFEGGEVVEHEASKNEEVLTEVLDTDPGARRIGELGIGMNRDIDRFTYNMLFDEKMGDTIHLALGRAYEDTVGEDNERNESAVHVDMIVDMSEDARIELDEEVVQRNGTFAFEDEFEG